MGSRPQPTSSSTSFHLHATDCERVPLEVEEVPGVRVLVTAGRLVTRLAFYVALGPDDGVEVIYLDVE